MKIGITIDMSTAFWANGMQQNIVFLYSMLRSIGHECHYVTYKEPRFKLDKSHTGMMLQDLLSDEKESLDVLIIAGFDLLPDMYEKLLKRNQKLKVVLVHFGNKMLDDIHYAICNPDTKREPIKTPKFLSEIWISPHHEFGKEYLKTYYNFENIKTAPYLWDPFFIQSKIKDLKNKNLSPFFDEQKVKRVCIFEPNISHIKNCIIPLAICERFEQKFPSILERVSSFACDKIREKPYFFDLMKRTSMVKKDKCYFNNRWGSLDALSKFGSTIISHQINNELNYAHLEALYLGLPLIHNSPRFENLGYYYPDFNVDIAANQLYSAILNHKEVLDDYTKDAREFINRFSPYNQSNRNKYTQILNELK